MSGPRLCTRLSHIHRLRLSQAQLQTPSNTSRSSRLSRRAYHSYESDQPAPYPPLETSILSHSLSHVPEHGFSTSALRAGARDAGCLDSTTNLFPRGAFEIVMFHLITQRLSLSSRVDCSTPILSVSTSTEPNSSKDKSTNSSRKSGVGFKVRELILSRLDANVSSGVLAKYQGALALMSLYKNIPSSMAELARLSDEIWFLAGDTSVDTSWYTKRASLASIYAATEIYQTTDQSTDFRDTKEFLDRRLEDVRVLGSAWRNTAQWAGFQGISAVNLARSLGARI